MHTIDLCFPFCLSLRHVQLDKFLRRKQLDVLRREEVKGDGKQFLQGKKAKFLGFPDSIICFCCTSTALQNPWTNFRGQVMIPW